MFNVISANLSKFLYIYNPLSRKPISAAVLNKHTGTLTAIFQLIPCSMVVLKLPKASLYRSRIQMPRAAISQVSASLLLHSITRVILKVMNNNFL
jgi:hypothetical protein